jgi:hypothetical protein
MVRWLAGGAWLGAGRGRTATGRTTAMAGASARPRGRSSWPRPRVTRGANRGARNKRPEHARTAATIGLRSRLARGPKHLRSNELEHLVALGLRGWRRGVRAPRSSSRTWRASERRYGRARSRSLRPARRTSLSLNVADAVALASWRALLAISFSCQPNSIRRPFAGTRWKSLSMHPRSQSMPVGKIT